MEEVIKFIFFAIVILVVVVSKVLQGRTEQARQRKEAAKRDLDGDRPIARSGASDAGTPARRASAGRPSSSSAQSDLEAFLETLSGKKPQARQKPAPPPIPTRQTSAPAPARRSSHYDYTDDDHAKRREKQLREQQELEQTRRERQAQRAQPDPPPQPEPELAPLPEFAASVLPSRRARAPRRKAISVGRPTVTSARHVPFELFSTGGAISRDDLVRTILMAELLGPPLALRRRGNDPKSRRMI